MTKPVLSATGLKDFEICARRFQLRYMAEQPWPAVSAEPLSDHEVHARRGIQLHHIVERYFSGIAPDTLSRMIDDPVVRRWWDAFQAHAPVDIDSNRVFLPERHLQCSIGDYRLSAVVDLLVLDKENRSISIFDWKTTRRVPDEADYHAAIQTRIYQYVVAETSQAFFSQFEELDRLKMIYWFPVYPDRSITITYSDTTHQQNRSWLVEQIKAIEAHLDTSEAAWPKTEALHHCRFCNYRSLCNRESLHVLKTDQDELDIEIDIVNRNGDYGQI